MINNEPLIARLLAREVVKAKIKMEGQKISSFLSKDITKAAEVFYKHNAARIKVILFDAVQTIIKEQKELILEQKALGNPAKCKSKCESRS